MAVTGPRSTANQSTTTTVVDMDDAIEMLDKFDVPLTSMLSEEGITNIRHDWLEDDLDAQTVAVNAAFTSGGATVTVIDSSNVRTRDLLQKVQVTGDDIAPQILGSTEQILEVTAVPTGTTITVSTTPWGGTTGANLASPDILQIIGQVPLEGADPQTSRDGDPTARFNVAQIFQERVDATRTARKNDQYGIDDPLERMKMRKFKELAIRLERAYLVGVRFVSADKKQRTFGGLFYHITTNVRSSTVAALRAGTNAMLRASFVLGASPDLLMVSPAIKQAYDDMDLTATGTTIKVEKDYGDTGIGITAESFKSSFGLVRLLINRHMPTNKSVALESGYVKRLIFDNWFYEDLAKTGDSDQGEIVGEFGFKVKNEKAHAVLNVTDAL
jgi:hypothetical protein